MYRSDASTRDFNDTCKALEKLNYKVINCALCPRLHNYIEKVDKIKTKRFATESYWSKPVPSFGDPSAKFLIIGLAPAAHGGNRTGRMFTGDGSGEWVAKALYETGFANIPTSKARNDGLVLNDAYITACIRCAPPDNRPLRNEIFNCSNYLEEEINLLYEKIEVILLLGHIAFDTFNKIKGIEGFKFAHGATFSFDSKTIISSYHPSRQNTNTKRLTWEMWIGIFKKAKSILSKKD